VAKTFFITTKKSPKLFTLPASEGDAQTVRLDFSAWAEDNAALTAVTWSVSSGNAAVSGQALASSVASALITTASLGDSIIKVTATDGTRTKVIYLRVVAEAVECGRVYDYGILV
jgi:hypothetical protein